MSAPKRYFLFVFPLSEMSHFHWFNIACDYLIYLYVCSMRINIQQYDRHWTALRLLILTCHIV